MRHFSPSPSSPSPASLPSLAAAEATTQILQQRTPDGSILLTDRPSPGAKTERSWQVEREDPAAARQRAIDVKAEANLVSERIQRSHRQPAARRRRSAAHAPGHAPARARPRWRGSSAQDGVSYGYAYGGVRLRCTPFRASRSPGPRVGDVGIWIPTGTRGRTARHGGHGRPSGSGSPGSR